ncbi:hypothetical protein [Saccharopolyspora sp. 5N708]|uniref:hypothetical protein n=1 Tax=Saccharopolyspora sp. 5N708 TaxID=3457424 RepID=UPI003FD3AB38
MNESWGDNVANPSQTNSGGGDNVANPTQTNTGVGNPSQPGPHQIQCVAAPCELPSAGGAHNPGPADLDQAHVMPILEKWWSWAANWF